MAIGYQPNYTPPAGLPPLKHFPGFIVSPGVINPTPAQLDAAWNQIFTVANDRKNKLRPPGIYGGIQGRLVLSRFYKNNGAVRPANPADHTDPQYDWTTWDAFFTCSAVVNDGALIYPQITMNRQAYSFGQPDWLWAMSGAYKGVFQTIGSNGTMWIPKFYRYSGPDLQSTPQSNQGSTPYIADEIMMFFTALRDHMVATGQINKIMSGAGIGEMLIQGTPTNIDGSALTDGYSQMAQYHGMGLVSKHCARIFAEVGIPTGNSTLLDGTYKTIMWPYMNSPYSVVGESYPDLKMTGDATFTGQSRFNDLNGVYQKDLRTLKQDNESNGVRQYITFSSGENQWGYPAGTTVLQKAVHILWNLGGSPKSPTKKKAGFGYAGAEDPPGNLPVHQITLNVNSSPAYAPTVAEWLEALDAFGPEGTFSVPYTMTGYFDAAQAGFVPGVARESGNSFSCPQLDAGENTEVEIVYQIGSAPAATPAPAMQLSVNGRYFERVI